MKRLMVGLIVGSLGFSACDNGQTMAPPVAMDVHVQIPLADVEVNPGVKGVEDLLPLEVTIRRASNNALVHIDSIPVPSQAGTLQSSARFTVDAGGEDFLLAAVAQSPIQAPVKFGPVKVHLVPGQPAELLVLLHSELIGVRYLEPDIFSAALSPGQTVQVSVIQRDSVGYVTQSTLTWSSTNAAVATVDSTGLITAGSTPGVASIRVSANGALNEVLVSVTRPEDRFTDIAAGDFATCGLAGNGTVYCWGNTQKIPLRVDGMPAMKRIFASKSRACGTTIDDQIYCWRVRAFAGSYDVTRIASTVAFSRLSAGDTLCATTADGVIYCEQNHAMAPASTSVRAAYISNGGAQDMCALTDDGKVYCNNIDFKKTPFTYVPLEEPMLAVAADHDGGACGVGNSGDLRCWGSLEHNAISWGAYYQKGQCPSGACAGSFVLRGNVRLASIVGGDRHYCGLTLDGQAYCWGINDSDALGIIEYGPQTCYDFSCSIEPVPVHTQYRFAKIVAGDAHTCGLTTEGQAICWGTLVSSVSLHGARGPRPITGERQ